MWVEVETLTSVLLSVCSVAGDLKAALKRKMNKQLKPVGG